MKYRSTLGVALPFAVIGALVSLRQVRQLPAEELRWEPSSGKVKDALFGRHALFVRRAEDGMGDIYRARVRLSPEGRVLEVASIVNLTDTPLGDDDGLVVEGSRAAYVTKVYRQVVSATALDLRGEGSQDKATTRLERIMSCVSNVQRTGSCAGLGRVDVTLEDPAPAASLALKGDVLTIDGKWTVDLARGEVAGPGASAQAGEHLPKRFVHWAVDTARAVSFIGPAPIAWLEDRLFALRDDARRLAAGKEELAPQAASQPVVDTWPPTRIAPIYKTPRPGEGEWTETWQKRSLGGAPPALMRTFVRPDEDRPYATVQLVAMDTRQLDLHMEAGIEDPRPMTGPPGPGKIPRDPAIYKRVLAAWNGGFKTEHGHFGMMVRGRELLPALPGIATVLTMKDGRVAMGTWGSGAIENVAAEDIDSFRQNLDPLLDAGVINPSQRNLWGWAAPGKPAQTERSGLCVTASGHLVYTWSDDANATTLARAMKMAGCVYGMHLDMNAYHAGFLFADIEDLPRGKYRTELLAPNMGIQKTRYLESAAKDFFYVTLRDPAPPAAEGGGAWKADGVQPAPAWLQGIHSAEIDVSEGTVQVTLMERVSFALRVGGKDAPLAQHAAREMTQPTLVALGLGTAPDRSPRGIAALGKTAVIPSGEAGWATLSIDEGRLKLGEGSDFVELPLLFDEQGAQPLAPQAPRPRAALGLRKDGRVVIASGTFASDGPLAEALQRMKCRAAVALDRGSHEAPLYDRSPRARYDQSVLYVMSGAPIPRGFRFQAEEAKTRAPAANSPF